MNIVPKGIIYICFFKSINNAIPKQNITQANIIKATIEVNNCLFKSCFSLALQYK